MVFSQSLGPNLQTCKKKKSQKCEQEEFEDTKEVIRIRIWKKNRQHNGLKKKYNDLQNIHLKLKIV